MNFEVDKARHLCQNLDAVNAELTDFIEAACLEVRNLRAANQVAKERLGPAGWKLLVELKILREFRLHAKEELARIADLHQIDHRREARELLENLELIEERFYERANTRA